MQEGQVSILYSILSKCVLDVVVGGNSAATCVLYTHLMLCAVGSADIYCSFK